MPRADTAREVSVLDGLDADSVRRWCRAAADSLGLAREEIDALNVFPVPDGDTGTNLHLTMLAAAEAVESLGVGADTAQTWRTLAHGALLGARGNSGVIVSQVLRGLADVLPEAVPCRGEALRRALLHATSVAYDAVGEPVEGTVLSVLRAAGQAAAAANDDGGDDLLAVARAAADGARVALARTTEQLDVLARSGVVDAGAAGLCVLLDVLAAVAAGERVPAQRIDVPAPRGDVPAADGRTDPTGPGYEVMYLLDSPDEVVPELRDTLRGLGESLVVVGGGGLWNVHVHVDDVGAAIEVGIQAGRPHRIRVTYLHAAEVVRHRRKGRGVVAVAAGEGLAGLFESAGADVVRREPDGCPSLRELLEAIRAAGDEVVLLPNENGAQMLAEAAAERARDDGIHTYVIPTEASVQGLAALAVHDPHRRLDEDVIAMTTAAGATRYGEITVAGRAAMTSAGICQPGDVLGLIEGDVSVIGRDMEGTACEIIDRMLSGGGELVTLITGSEAEAGLADRVVAHLHGTRPDVDTVVYEGGQDRYPLLVGVE
ncbi:MAG: DAK2 domain-containing protein [Streptosporangiales bacterium]|nr:DAK2 domain-containing protein [Streptosporangiales bacterium]